MTRLRTDYPSQPEHGQSYYARRLREMAEELEDLRDFFEMTSQKTIRRRLDKAVGKVIEAADHVDEDSRYMNREHALASDTWRNRA